MKEGGVLFLTNWIPVCFLPACLPEGLEIVLGYRTLVLGNLADTRSSGFYPLMRSSIYSKGLPARS